MNILEQRLTSDKIDACAIAGLGSLCLVLATVLPEAWNFAALTAGAINFFWAYRVYTKAMRAKTSTRGWRWD